jgi:hypothetical protein
VLNSNTTTMVRMVQMEWLTMLRSSCRNMSSEMSVRATLPMSTGFGLRECPQPVTVAQAAPHHHTTAAPTLRSQPSFGWNQEGCGSSSVDHSDPSRHGDCGHDASEAIAMRRSFAGRAWKDSGTMQWAQ